MGKARKLIITVREFNKENNVTDYNINGIDNTSALYFYREPQGQFMDLPKGDYTVIGETNNLTLRITNQELLAKAERFQIGYLFDFSSSTYDPEFGTDVNILKDRYNELAEDVKELFAYVKKNMMVADGEEIDTILPQLDENEVWVRTKTGYRGFSIGDLEANIKAQIERFQQLVKEALVQIDKKKEQVVAELDKVAEQNITQMDEKVKEVGVIVQDGINKIGESITVVDGKFDLIWRMYSVIIGSNRYLSGNNISLRKEQNLERVVDSGKIKDRTGEPRKTYTGGKIGDRGIVPPSYYANFGGVK